MLELVDLIQNGYVSKQRQKLIDQERIGPYLRPSVVFKDSNDVPPVSKKRKAQTSEDMTDGSKRIKANEDEEEVAVTQV